MPVTTELHQELTAYLKADEDHADLAKQAKELQTKLETLDRQKTTLMSKLVQAAGVGQSIRERHVLITPDGKKAPLLIRLRYLEGITGKIQVEVITPETASK